MALATPTRKLRYPQNTDQFNPPADFQRLAGDVDGHLFPSVATPGDLPGTDNWDGRLIHVKSVDAIYRYFDSWAAATYIPLDVPASGYAIGAPWTAQPGSRITKEGPEVSFIMNLNSTGGGIATGAGFGSVPAAVRPTNNQYVPFMISSGVGRGTGFAEIATTGAVTLLNMTAQGGTFVRFNTSYRLD